MSERRRIAGGLEERYPHIARWVKAHGWIEIGSDGYYRRSSIRVLDEGGMVWEGAEEYATLDAAFEALEAALREVARDLGY